MYIFKNFLFLTLLNLSLTYAAFALPDGWVNPGGMWMPSQLVEQEHILRALGLEIDPRQLSDPASDVLQSIVHLGNCSGSFISEQGLIITNHHCVQAILSYLTQVDRSNQIHHTDYVKNGFISHNQTEERSAPPTKRVYVTEKVTDVTNRVLERLEQIADPVQRTKELENRIKAIIKETEQGRPHIRAEINAFYGGAQYFLTEKLEIKDVRIVFAPPNSIGKLAGDDDNWRFPRHVGDFGVLRAYVGPDGVPAPYSPHNVPYRPKNIFTISARGLKVDDLLLVAGYPGLTSRLITEDQLKFQLENYIPEVIDFLKAILAFIDHKSNKSDLLRTTLESDRQSYMNSLQNREGAYANMQKWNLLEDKQEFEKKFRAWIAADSERQTKYGTVLDEIAKVSEEARESFRGDLLFSILLRHTSLLGSAVRISRMAEERQKPDEQREVAYQQRQWERLHQAEEQRQTTYLRELDLGFAEFVIERALKLPARVRPAWLSRVIDEKALAQGHSIKAQLEALYRTTTLEALDTRQQLLDHATPDKLKKHADPLIKLGYKLAQAEKANEQKIRTQQGQLILLNPNYMEALKAFINAPVAPDANSTLRVTYGHVKGYTEPETRRFIHPFTTVSQMLEKAKAHGLKYSPDAPYNAPQEVFQAVAERRFGIYGNRETGDVPVNFVADVDTTGGNSGSAAMNRHGQLVGLLFDGTLHSLGRDWKFGPDGRSILLDIRYALWLMDEVYGLKHLIAEMRINAPTCEMYLRGIKD